jgi:hypothetical protein
MIEAGVSGHHNNTRYRISSATLGQLGFLVNKTSQMKKERAQTILINTFVPLIFTKTVGKKSDNVHRSRLALGHPS